MSPTTARAIVRKSCIGTYTARQLIDRYNYPVSVRRAQQLLRSSVHLKYQISLKAPRRIEKHKVGRLNWAREHVGFSNEDWGKVIFTDGKKFRLDGHNGNISYWHDLQQIRDFNRVVNVV